MGELPHVEDQEQVIQLEAVDQKITLEFLQAIFNPGQAAHSVFYNPDEVGLLVYPGLFLVFKSSESCMLTSLEEIMYVGIGTQSIKKAIEESRELNMLCAFADRIAKDNNPLGVFYWVNPLATPGELILLHQEIVETLKPFGNCLR